jgi:peptide-methionine (R)-S-oxide reductase
MYCREVLVNVKYYDVSRTVSSCSAHLILVVPHFLVLALSENKYFAADSTKDVGYNTLTPEEEKVIMRKGTEAPFIGEYDNFFEEGTFICKRCNAPLFSSKSKFDAGCGWPAFDDTLSDAVRRVPDPDGLRTEIECGNCGAHLGHEFVGERLTAKDTRECVNSISIRFIPKARELPKVIHG